MRPSIFPNILPIPESIFHQCISLLRVKLDGTIASAEHKGEAEYNVGSTLNLINTPRATIGATSLKSVDTLVAWHTGIKIQDWPNYIYKGILHSTDMIDPQQPVPSIEFASRTASQGLSRQIAAQFFLHRQYLKAIDTENPAASQAATLHHVIRHFRLSRPMYIVTQTILTLYLVVLLIYRLSLSKPFLLRQPFTIASQIAYAAASHVIDDVAAALFRVEDNAKFRSSPPLF